jgi:hypothetical protein
MSLLSDWWSFITTSATLGTLDGKAVLERRFYGSKFIMIYNLEGDYLGGKIRDFSYGHYRFFKTDKQNEHRLPWLARLLSKRLLVAQ